MAKRRNAKKEKAARNQINARKFRKQTSRYSKRGRRYYNNNEQKTSETNSDNTSSSKSSSNTEKVDRN